MYSLINNCGINLAMRKELIPLVLAFILAEFFYKWHSFALECVGFLVTWYLISFVTSKILKT